MNAPDEIKAVLGMTSETIGKDLLSALVTEIKLLPDVWQKLSEEMQGDIIDRLRKRVETNVKMAVDLLASEGRTCCIADLEGVTIKDEIKATFKVARANEYESMQHLFDSVGKACLLVVAEVGAHTGGMDEVQADPNQRGLNLGDEDQGGDGTVVDGEATEVPGLPAPTPEHDGEADGDPIYADAVRAVITEQRPSISFVQRTFRIGYNRAARLLERMEKEGIVSPQDANGGRQVWKTLEDLGEGGE